MCRGQQGQAQCNSVYKDATFVNFNFRLNLCIIMLGLLLCTDFTFFNYSKLSYLLTKQTQGGKIEKSIIWDKFDNKNGQFRKRLNWQVKLPLFWTLYKNTQIKLLANTYNFVRGPSLKGGGWIYLTGEGCWTSGGGWKSRWLQWPEGPLIWSLVWCTVLIIFLINHADVKIK